MSSTSFQNFKHCFCSFFGFFALLYADDTVLMAETHDDLQNILNKFGDYCNTWRLKAQ
jgi:hypothetical protein